MTVRVWRASWQLRTLGGFAYAFAVGLALGVVFAHSTVDDPSNLAFLPIMGLYGAWNAAMALGTRVRLDGDSIVVVNTLVTYRYPLAALRAIQSHKESFLVLELVDGRRRSCWAIQATNIMLWMGKRTRVDKVGDEVRDATQGRLGGAETVTVDRRWSGFPWHGWVLLGGLQAMGIVWLVLH